jgi:single-strand DNA-binding protein
MYHTIVLVGRLGREPELRTTPDGKAVCNLNIATDDGFGDKKKTVWFRVTVWDKQAENVNQYLHKGSQVLVEGRLNAGDNGTPRVYERQDGTHGASYEVTAQTVRFLGGKTEQAETEDYNEFEF